MASVCHNYQDPCFCPGWIGGEHGLRDPPGYAHAFKKVWGASPRKFRNFRINLVHSGVYAGGFFVEMGT